jgi:methylenetetrahydrofolate dehydrogenase (NADP+)/methenyltetrahydrofolate cyclohydrolase
MQLLDGKIASAAILNKISKHTSAALQQGYRKPHLAAILIGNNGASETYVASKVKTCAQIGFDSSLIRFDENITETTLLKKIDELNQNENIDGILVQLPLPNHIAEEKIIHAINPNKDVDGFHPYNVGMMATGAPTFIPATPYGILLMLEHYQIPTKGKHAVVIGRSHIVGTPISILLSRKGYPGDCTVTLCHSATTHLKEISLQADILIAALGKTEFVTADMVKPGAVVIDVGITRVVDLSKKSGFSIKGDVKFDEVAPICSAITPVPGGVGLMTIAGLMMNTWNAYQRHIAIK